MANLVKESRLIDLLLHVYIVEFVSSNYLPRTRSPCCSYPGVSSDFRWLAQKKKKKKTVEPILLPLRANCRNPKKRLGTSQSKYTLVVTWKHTIVVDFFVEDVLFSGRIIKVQLSEVTQAYVKVVNILIPLFKDG